MQQKRDSAPVEQLELALEFAPPVIAPHEVPRCTVSNVVRVQFGLQKATLMSSSSKDRALVERILQSAQRLKW